MVILLQVRLKNCHVETVTILLFNAFEQFATLTISCIIYKASIGSFISHNTTVNLPEERQQVTPVVVYVFLMLHTLFPPNWS